MISVFAVRIAACRHHIVPSGKRIYSFLFSSGWNNLISCENAPYSEIATKWLLTLKEVVPLCPFPNKWIINFRIKVVIYQTIVFLLKITHNFRFVCDLFPSEPKVVHRHLLTIAIAAFIKYFYDTWASISFSPSLGDGNESRQTIQNVQQN